jgi:hypothetical protein
LHRLILTVTLDNTDDSARSLKARIEHAAEFFVLLGEGVHLVQQQRQGAQGFHNSKNAAGADIVGLQRTTADIGKYRQQR